MKLAVVTDEISADLETALELAKEWGLDGVELRGIDERRFPNVSEFWLARVPELLAEFQLPVVALSPGLFKIPYPEAPTAATRVLRWEDEMVFQRYRTALDLVHFHLEEFLPKTIEAAKLLGAQIIVAFSFNRNEGVPPTATVPAVVIDALKEAAAMVQAANLTLAIEVEHVCWGSNGRRTAEIVRRIDNPAIGINWDPANAYRAGSDLPYPEGYEAVRSLIRHVHYKDAAIVNSVTGERGFVFDGAVNWSGQIKALIEDGYDGYLSIETHVRPKVEMARRSIEKVRKWMQEA